MPPQSKSTPRNPELAILGEAFRIALARSPHTTKTAVAEASKLENKQVGSYMRGRMEPSYRNFRRLCRGLGIKPSALLEIVEDLEAREEASELVLGGGMAEAC